GEFTQVSATTRQAGVLLGTLERDLGGAVQSRQARLAIVDRDIATAAEADRAIEQRKSQLTETLSTARQSGRDALTRARRLADVVRAGTAAGALVEGETLAAGAKDKLQQVLNDLLDAERKDRVARTEKDLRAARQRLTSIDKGFKDFDAAARPSS